MRSRLLAVGMVVAGVVLGGCATGRTGRSCRDGALPPLQIGQTYDINTRGDPHNSGVHGEAVVLGVSADWLKVDFGPGRGTGGSARVLWIPRDSTEWIGVPDRKPSE
jgi:hypothetical protein